MRIKEKNKRFFNPSIFPKSRRGDISTFVLVIGVFLVCTLAIFSFIFFNNSNKESFENVVENMAIVNSIAEQIRFYENIGQDPASFLDITKENNEYNIALNKMDGDERLFGVQYIFRAKAQAPQ